MTKGTRKASKKATEARINGLITKAIVGIQIPIMEVPKIWRIAEFAVAAGDNDETVKAKVLEYVGTCDWKLA